VIVASSGSRCVCAENSDSDVSVMQPLAPGPHRQAILETTAVTERLEKLVADIGDICRSF
jgi:hypothetical protein